ncbi:MAG: hypothetical protein J0H67_16015 [Rhodospirillales bacterium]|nr:hypothetical protein [Rhodospirillales bacterium]
MLDVADRVGRTERRQPQLDARAPDRAVAAGRAQPIEQLGAPGQQQLQSRASRGGGVGAGNEIAQQPWREQFRRIDREQGGLGLRPAAQRRQQHRAGGDRRGLAEQAQARVAQSQQHALHQGGLADPRFTGQRDQANAALDRPQQVLRHRAMRVGQEQRPETARLRLPQRLEHGAQRLRLRRTGLGRRGRRTRRLHRHQPWQAFELAC